MLGTQDRFAGRGTVGNGVLGTWDGCDGCRSLVIGALSEEGIGSGGRRRGVGLAATIGSGGRGIGSVACMRGGGQRRGEREV